MLPAVTMAAARSHLGARVSDHGEKCHRVGQRGVDVPHIPVHLHGPAAAAVPAYYTAAVPTEHQVTMQLLKATLIWHAHSHA